MGHFMHKDDHSTILHSSVVLFNLMAKALHIGYTSHPSPLQRRAIEAANCSQIARFHTTLHQTHEKNNVKWWDSVSSHCNAIHTNPLSIPIKTHIIKNIWSFRKDELSKMWYKSTSEYSCLLNFKQAFMGCDNIIKCRVYEWLLVTEGMNCILYRLSISILYIYA